MITLRSCRAILAALAFLLGPGAALAESWPDRPIRFVVLFPPGGSTDIVGRLIAEKLSKSLGQSVIVGSLPAIAAASSSIASCAARWKASRAWCG